MKKNCSRKMRRRSKQLLYMGQEPLVKMPAIANKCWCCGNHQDDWRY